MSDIFLKAKVLDAKKLIEEEKKLYCEKNKNGKEGFYDNINNLGIENSAKNKGPKNKGDECFCRSSQTQFRSTTPRRVKNSLRLRRLFNDNEHQQENEFLCDCGSSKNETINKGIHENIPNLFTNFILINLKYSLSFNILILSSFIQIFS